MSSTSAQISWVSAGNGGYDLLGWTLDVKAGVAPSRMEKIEGERRSYWLTGLACSSEYELRLKANNQEGGSDYSSAVKIITRGSGVLTAQSTYQA